MCKSLLHSSKLTSGFEGLQSKAGPLPGVEIRAPRGWHWPLEGSTIKSIRKSHFSEWIRLCRGCTAGMVRAHSASRLPVDGAVQDQKQTHGKERTFHNGSGARGSRSRAGLPVLLLLFLATILTTPSSSQSRLPKEPFGLLYCWLNVISWSVALVPSSELGYHGARWPIPRSFSLLRVSTSIKGFLG